MINDAPLLARLTAISERCYDIAPLVPNHRMRSAIAARSAWGSASHSINSQQTRASSNGALAQLTPPLAGSASRNAVNRHRQRRLAHDPGADHHCHGAFVQRPSRALNAAQRFLVNRTQKRKARYRDRPAAPRRCSP